MCRKSCLFVACLLISLITFSQTQTDTSRNLTAKQERKYLDSLSKNLAPLEGKAIVYIVRTGSMGMAIPFRLDCDSLLVGWIAYKTYLYTVLDTGEHLFKAQSENEFNLKVTLEGGKIYFLEQQSRMGIMYARTKLKILSEDEGRKSLSKCTLSKHNRYPQVILSRDYGQSSPDKGE